MYLKSDAVNDARNLTKYWLTNTLENEVFVDQDEAADDDAEQTALVNIYERRRNLKGMTGGTARGAQKSSDDFDDSINESLRGSRNQLLAAVFQRVQRLAAQWNEFLYQSLDAVGIKI
ncbi:MAG TPA: hypothetical protein V6C97_18530 [Oculatellaceae cyanobacterium]